MKNHRTKLWYESLCIRGSIFKNKTDDWHSDFFFFSVGVSETSVSKA